MVFYCIISILLFQVSGQIVLIIVFLPCKAKGHSYINEPEKQLGSQGAKEGAVSKRFSKIN